MSLEALRASLADRYRIERELGAGGMATVYLAHDLRHDRDVAIKVLHADLGAALGPDRFLAEIRTTARLQHPHILPLLDSGEANGLLYYVMPLVTGETLRTRLERERQLPVDDAVRIAREVADALHHAHGHGVIHRDIKPENILLQGGHALVADFGIALAVQSAGGARMTQTGLSLGTPQYMSPEQAMGERTIDARSDIYALAAVTYEMLVGEPPFTGPSVQAIVARVMTEEPRGLTIQRRAIPEHVDDAVLQGLEKLPADRITTAAEFATALGGGATMHTRASGRRTAARGVGRPTPRWRDPVVLGLLLMALGSLAWAAWSRTRAVPSDGQVVAFAMPFSETGSVVLGYSSLSISRDGQLLVYPTLDPSGRRLLAVRRLDATEEQLLPGTEDASNPVFSPGGESVAYIRGNQLFRASISGGPPEPLGTAPGTFVGMSWSSDGRIILSGNTALLSLPERGGTATTLGAPGAATGERFFLSPMVWDEGGVVFFGSLNRQNISASRIAVAPLDGGPRTVLELPGIHPVGVLDGVLVYVSATGTLMGVRFDAAERRTIGEPVPLVVGIRFNQTTGIARVALSRTGTLIYERGSQLSQVVMAAPGGRIAPLLSEGRDYAFPRLSPDGRTLAVTVGQGGRRDIWLYDLETGSPSRLTTDGNANERPEWSPDGSRVLYRSDRDSNSTLWWRPADQSRAGEPLLVAGAANVFEGVFSPDGAYLAYQQDTTGADVFYQRVGDSTAHPVANNPTAIEHMPRISPDGRWIAFVTDESGQEAVVVQPFPGPGGRVQVSTGAGAQPVWSRDGNRLVYRTGGWFVSARVQRSPTFTVLSRDTLMRDDFVYATNPHANYDVAPDGRLVVLQPFGDGERVVVSNWRRVLDSLMTAAGSR
jgi:serine/threonine-protein kinase